MQVKSKRILQSAGIVCFRSSALVAKKAGNPTTFKGVTKTYNSKNQQAGTGFVYDGNGNPTTYNGTTLTFDPENRITAYGSALTAGYNGDGLRAWKQNGSGRTYFLYDGINPVVEMDSTASVTATTTFGANGLVSRQASSASVFYSFDSEGSVSQRTDSTGAVFSNHLFSAHGSALSGTLTDPFGYKAQVGYYTDTETGLQLLTNRFYDPNTGRFLTRDPISYDGGINLYSYVANNPSNALDPLGFSGSDIADWADSKLDYADRYWQYGGNEPVANTINSIIIGGSTDTIRGFADLLRVGSGTGDAIFAQDENGYGRAAFVLEDVVRSAAIIDSLGGLASGLVPEACETKTWPNGPNEMDDLLGMKGRRIPDGPNTGGRGKVEWKPSDKVKIEFEQHPYHPNAPAYHRGPHWHLSTPGKPHVRYLPGEPMP